MLYHNGSLVLEIFKQNGVNGTSNYKESILHLIFLLSEASLEYKRRYVYR